ncbi:hypothetical protein JFL43_13695 [Viridibacillus sp. YIM B01967]|uniref:Uncharacterized protein n=1 Tax=Viridibacillus soli TaxID=2798301 RepID=A0ABS1H8Z1_9BACL|nr:hypothetical protein [Viridibacillus soli]MBK3495893.1 hypothetical protein [Viridibacillus soli]
MNESNNQAICTMTYHIVERIVGWYEQTTNRTHHRIYLYADAVSTAKNIFKLEHVHDMSYKPFSGGSGLFYLHTNQGVFMFEIDVDPTHFIQMYKRIRE